jgi:hypothetical protein
MKVRPVMSGSTSSGLGPNCEKRRSARRAMLIANDESFAEDGKFVDRRI